MKLKLLPILIILSSCTPNQLVGVPDLFVKVKEAIEGSRSERVSPTPLPTPEVVSTPNVEAASSATWTEHGVVKPLPAEYGTVDCKPGQKFFGDGKPGWLWKPKSDTSPSPVLLVPGRFKKYTNVKVCARKKPTDCIALDSHSLGNPDGAMPRHHYKNWSKGLHCKRCVVHLGECKINVGTKRID